MPHPLLVAGASSRVGLAQQLQQQQLQQLQQQQQQPHELDPVQVILQEMRSQVSYQPMIQHPSTQQQQQHRQNEN